MNKDDIIRMAREAGFDIDGYVNKTGEFVWADGEITDELERFARLVAAAEREACAISCEVNAARWIDAGGKQWYAAHECAAAIRARGQS